MKLEEMNKEEMMEWARESGLKINNVVNKRINYFNKTGKYDEKKLQLLIKLGKKFSKDYQFIMLQNIRGKLSREEMEFSMVGLKSLKKEIATLIKGEGK